MAEAIATGVGTGRVLVAGVGNVFLGDDGFGCEVVRGLVGHTDGATTVKDYGIGGIHLAYDLLEGYDLLVLVDTVRRGAPAGTLAVIEVDTGAVPDAPLDAHAMDPMAVLANVGALGGTVPRTLLVACEPEDVEEGMGLSPVVQVAIEPARRLVHDVLAEHAPTAVAAADQRED